MKQHSSPPDNMREVADETRDETKEPHDEHLIATLSDPNDVLPPTAVLFREAFAFYKRHISLILSIGLPPVIIAIGGYSMTVLNPASDFTIAISVLAGLISMFARLALYQMMIENGQSEGGAFGAYARGTQLFLSFLWINLLLGIIIFGGFVFFIIPGLILLIRLSLAPYILFNEDRKGVASLTQSWHYIDGHGKQVVLRYLIFFIFIIFIALGIAAALFAMNIISSNADDDLFDLSYGVINELLLTPLIIIFTARIYERLKAAKSDIDPKIEEARRARSLMFYAAVGAVALVAAVGFLFVASIYFPEVLEDITPQDNGPIARFAITYTLSAVGLFQP